MNKSKSPIPTTKWGTACAQCAAAKAKCSRQSDTPGSKCDRCERLLKTCTEQVQRPRKPRQARTRKESTASSPCGYTCGSLLPPASTSTSSTAVFISSSSTSTDIPSQQTNPSRSATSSPSLSVALSPPPPASQTSVPPLDNLNLNRPRSPSNPPADEDALQIFITHIQPSFPFILVPNNVNSQALAVERPLLMSAIRLAAATTSTSTAGATSKASEVMLRRQVYHFVQHVSNMVLLKGEGNLETLMAIVILLGRWRWWCTRHGGRYNSLLGVAEALVGDLGLARPSSSGTREEGEGEEKVTDDEKRLVVGVWYLRSCAATNLSQLSPTSLSAYVLQCLNDLEMSSHLSDRVLVQIVKIQHLEQRIARLNEELLATLTPEADESGAMNRIVALRSEWEVLNRSSSASSESMQNPLITSHLRTAFLRLHEPLLTHPPTTLTHLYASALGNGVTPGAGMTAMIFQPFVDTWQLTISRMNNGLMGLPTPIMTMHLSHFTSLLFQLCFALRSTSAFPGIQDPSLPDSIREQVPLLGVLVGPELMALLLAIAESVTEACMTAGGAQGPTTPARITSILSNPSSLYPLVLSKWVSFAINGGILSSSAASGNSMSSSSTSHPGLSNPPNPALLSASATGSPFMATDSEYEDYELDFDVDIDIGLPGVPGQQQGIQYSGYHSGQVQAHGQRHQGYGQPMQQQWSSAGTVAGWPVSSPEENAGMGATMFWGQAQGHQGHGHQGHQGHQEQEGWGQGR